MSGDAWGAGEKKTDQVEIQKCRNVAGIDRFWTNSLSVQNQYKIYLKYLVTDKIGVLVVKSDLDNTMTEHDLIFWKLNAGLEIPISPFETM